MEHQGMAMEGRPPGRSPSVLLVDDDAACLDEMSLLARRCGLEVFSAEEGATALKLLCQHRPMLAVIDIRLPAIDGGRLAVLASGLQPLLLVVLVSGDRELLSQVPTSEPCIVARLTKPLDIARLEVIFRAAGGTVDAAGLAAP